ncbi:MAG TPA: prolipoprotein diacylglyceryl transferase [Candidatus Limnocylindria bacterium]|nr:prolipoprotein diacylglyceryl transferase [Candidatus Limnocylindria bacterium]
MIPDTLRVGPIPVHLFGLFLAIAFLVAGRVATKGLVRLGYSEELGGSVLTAAVVGSLLGAKLWLVVAEWRAFVAQPIDFLLSGSGWVFYGGLLGGMLAVSWVFRRDGVPWLRGADACAPAIVVGQAIGRLGCQVSGDGDWGVVTTLPWGMRYPHAVVGWPYEDPSIRVHPTPLYEAAAYFAIFFFLLRRREHAAPDGTIFAWYLVLASGARFLVEFVRTNEVVAAGFTAAQLTSLVLMTAGATLLARGARWRPAAA